MVNVLVTGANGQLASSIKDLESQYDNLNFIYTDYLELDITDKKAIQVFFNSFPNINYCINCAAYTAVDKAEEERERAEKINAIGAKNLAEICKNENTTIIHISTDFVFEGTNAKAYKETDLAKPISVYGSTKLEGELHIARISPKYFILRTSWLYSEYGKNFMKTMLSLANYKEELDIVTDQIGTPTYATDLASVIFKIVTTNNTDYGIYHYSNEGVASWYDFAKAIFEISNTKIKVYAITTEAYPTPAKRPHFSILDKTKIKNILKIDVPYWRDSLKIAISKYNE
ncbi:dTDP-4-dehydrorhamnose reductase [Winogradskyella sp. A2]|uniref:dTDP-4-dehydrorhamnose reductase n=1 Tax=Winogradskyella sp. A2 TaxID=3366944 RepID=UPI00398C6D3C